MSDKISLRIGDTAVEHFLSYSIDADLYTPADAFRMELSAPETRVTAGMRCEVWVNDQRELTGIIDRVTRRVTKSGRTLSVEGRDLMGLLVDSCCESFQSVKNKSLKELAALLLPTIPYINRKAVVYQKSVSGKSETTTDLLDEPQKITQIEPGMTVFDVLKSAAVSRGLLFYSLPDGTLVFGRPKAKGETSFTLQQLRTGTGNNIIESELVEDISRQYSKVTVLGQQQGRDDLDTAKIKTKATKTDSDFPFYKPFVQRNNNDGTSPALLARLLMEKGRREGWQYSATVARHSQDGKNWTINELARVKDEVQALDGVYLIYGRTFELDKNLGPVTRLKLSKVGLI
ncbi:MAG: Phage late control gene D protein (GPD) [Syntrophaceae bacterium PtaB.Bin095]|jgi:prophage tail gpP-like protein|nr:MAG: Phage late control gene D protein (GPD) [Syntrophaceae bacterium PtaB.Bin095]